MASHPIYQFYAELVGFKPKIWRRFQVNSNISVARFGYILQILFEMKASHLMTIEVPFSENLITYYKTRNPDLPPDHSMFDIEKHIWRYEFIQLDEDMFPPPENVETEDATEALLKAVVSRPNDKLTFIYDFGDGWHVSLILEKVIKDKDFPANELPKVLEGAGFGIVEDVGGIWGLTEFVKAFKKKKGNSYKHYSEWYGEKDFDITSFDIDDMNFRLKKLPRIYKEIYEDDVVPNQVSIDLIERKYLEKKS